MDACRRRFDVISGNDHGRGVHDCASGGMRKPYLHTSNIEREKERERRVHLIRKYIFFSSKIRPSTYTPPHTPPTLVTQCTICACTRNWKTRRTANNARARRCVYRRSRRRRRPVETVFLSCYRFPRECLIYAPATTTERPPVTTVGARFHWKNLGC